jgi:phage-related tail protein
MCELCTKDPVEKKNVVENLHAEAEKFRRFANKITAMANGTIKPHSEEAGKMANDAKHLIHVLVVGWL